MIKISRPQKASASLGGFSSRLPDGFQAMDSKQYPRVAPSPTSLTLIDRLRVVDSSAWSDFVWAYSGVIRKWIRQYGVPESSVKDVAQDVFGDVSQQIERFTPNERTASFRGWLKTITRGKSADFLRKQQGPTARGGTSALIRLAGAIDPASKFDGENGDDEWSRNEIAILIDGVLAQFREESSEQKWLILKRICMDGNNAKSVAEELGISPCAARQSKARTLRKLREKLEAAGVQFASESEEIDDGDSAI